MKRPVIFITSGLVVITVLLAILYIYSDRNVYRIKQQQSAVTEYDRHYCLVSMDHSSFWQGLYHSAVETARENDACLEWIGLDSPVEYSLEDCLRIAITSGVDGIVLYPGSAGADETVVSLIDEAAGKGIPVVTVISDSADAQRISYVGINNIQMGELYANRILSSLHDGMNRICILADTDADNANVSLIYSQMLQALEQGRGPEQEVDLQVEPINTRTGFDAEEEIRDIFVMKEELPDILVCMDLVATESAIQALVDYNRVGTVDVIGTFTSQTVMDAISKGIIMATVDVDESEVGRLCVGVLSEYDSLGYASNYLNISLNLITQDNFADYVDDIGTDSSDIGDGSSNRETEGV